MPKTREQKKEILEGLKDKISRSKSVIFTKFNGLQVKENEELRNALREENSEYLVAKKTLFGIALKENGIEDVDVKSFDGRVAAVFGYEDEVAPAKLVDKFMSANEGKIEFVGGVMENKFIDAVQVKQLASLPSKQELYAKIVGSMNAPVSGFVNVLAGNLRGLVTVLKAIEEKK